jgi:Icc-related predicted phosphoesterase
MARLVCISDTHTYHNELTLPDGDFLIHAGDFTKTGRAQDIISFVRWFASQPHKHKVLVAGNHDLTLDTAHYRNTWHRWHRYPEDEAMIRDYIEREESITYLQDREVTLGGLRIYGSPWQPEFGGWGFNLPRNSPQIKRVWDEIPTGLDLLVTHSPPYGILDKVDSDSVGCSELLSALESARPRVHVFGHIHEGYGTEAREHTFYINACSCDGGYKAVNNPIVYDLEEK